MSPVYPAVRFKRGTKKEALDANPILKDGELFVEYPDSGIGTGPGAIKLGNGKDTYDKLSYFIDGTRDTIETRISIIVLFIAIILVCLIGSTYQSKVDKLEKRIEVLEEQNTNKHVIELEDINKFE